MGHLLVAVGDASAGQVVRCEFNLNPVARKNSDVVPAHLSRDVAEHGQAILELDPEHGVRERLDDRAFEDNRIFLGLGQDVPPRRTGESALSTEMDTDSAALLTPGGQRHDKHHGNGRPTMLVPLTHRANPKDARPQ